MTWAAEPLLVRPRQSWTCSLTAVQPEASLDEPVWGNCDMCKTWEGHVKMLLVRSKNTAALFTEGNAWEVEGHFLNVDWFVYVRASKNHMEPLSS